MSTTTQKALELWGMEGATCRLIAERENRVFRVDFKGRSYALRLHRKGYRSDIELWSELQWMTAVSKGGLFVPDPIASISGDFLRTVDDIQVDMLTWLAGTPLGAAHEELNFDDRIGLFQNIGREMARLHEVSDRWNRPDGFSRPSWDRQGLVGERPAWGRFWDNPTLSNQDQALFQEVRRITDEDLFNVEDGLDYGLVHADLVRENILVDGDQLQFIDFDDGGFGFRLFDLATTLMPNLYEKDFPELRSALLNGYRSIREIDTASLDLFLLLRSNTYLGWIITRMDEEGARTRNRRFITRSKMLAENYLDNRAL